jgi:hypothetical protein
VIIQKDLTEEESLELARSLNSNIPMSEKRQYGVDSIVFFSDEIGVFK